MNIKGIPVDEQLELFSNAVAEAFRKRLLRQKELEFENIKNHRCLTENEFNEVFFNCK